MGLFLLFAYIKHYNRDPESEIPGLIVILYDLPVYPTQSRCSISVGPLIV